MVFMKLYKKGVSGWGFVIFIILIFVGITFLNKGAEDIKTAPVASVVETGKDVINVSKTIIDKTGDVIEVIKEPSNPSNLGQIPCNTDEECNRLEACQSGNNTLCKCESGFCILR